MKKLVALSLILALSVSMVACGQSNTPVSTETESQTPASTETEVANTEDGNTEVADTETADTEAPVTGDSLGQTMLANFNELMADGTARTDAEIAEALINNPAILFMPMTMPMEAGFFSGLTEEISDFQSATMFGPAIGTIPFIGYVFTLEEGADVEAFKAKLESIADPRWNICTAAEETVIESNGNTVFFLMCPLTLDAE